MSATDNIDGVELQVTNKVFTLANFFSVSRIFIAAPIIYVYFLYDGISLLFTILVAYGIFSDYLDGWAARKYNDISELGKVIDPIADKIMAGILFVFATYIGLIPLWFLITTLSRDALIMAGSIYVRINRGKVAMSVMSGKVFVNVLALYWLVAIYFPYRLALVDFFMIATTALMVYSFFDYVYRFIRILQGAKFN